MNLASACRFLLFAFLLIQNAQANYLSYQTITSGGGFFSSSTTTVRHESSRNDAIGNSVSGDSVNILAGYNNSLAPNGGEGVIQTGDINISGSDVAGTRDVALNAAGDITIKAATSTYKNSSYVHTEESGLMSNGGLSITLGSREQTDQNSANGSIQSQNRSMIGSTNGNLNITAGNNATVTGSDIVAAKDINLLAENVTLDTGLDTNTQTRSHDMSQSGLTLSITSPVIAAVQTVQQMQQAASQTKDGRAKTLAGMTAAMSAMSAYGAVQAGQTVMQDGKNVANGADRAGGINVSISLQKIPGSGLAIIHFLLA